MHNRITAFADTFNILFQNQFGFRKNHSTSLALINLINKVATSVDKSEVTASIFLDLSKAFDTLDHEILFSKLEHYGIHNTSIIVNNLCKLILLSLLNTPFIVVFHSDLY
jgi:hypothetical protein